jgi:hypothetical protein
MRTATICPIKKGYLATQKDEEAIGRGLNTRDKTKVIVKGYLQDHWPVEIITITSTTGWVTIGCGIGT